MLRGAIIWHHLYALNAVIFATRINKKHMILLYIYFLFDSVIDFII